MKFSSLHVRGRIMDTDHSDDSKVYLPELVLCLCAAAGTDTATVVDAISTELRTVDYKPVPVKLSKLIAQVPGFEDIADIKAEDDRIRRSMDVTCH